jgi:hypothetical protein
MTSTQWLIILGAVLVAGWYVLGHSAGGTPAASVPGIYSANTSGNFGMMAPVSTVRFGTPTTGYITRPAFNTGMGFKI